MKMCLFLTCDRIPKTFGVEKGVSTKVGFHFQTTITFLKASGTSFKYVFPYHSIHANMASDCSHCQLRTVSMTMVAPSSINKKDANNQYSVHPHMTTCRRCIKSPLFHNSMERGFLRTMCSIIGEFTAIIGWAAD